MSNNNFSINPNCNIGQTLCIHCGCEKLSIILKPEISLLHIAQVQAGGAV